MSTVLFLLAATQKAGSDTYCSELSSFSNQQLIPGSFCAQAFKELSHFCCGDIQPPPDLPIESISLDGC